MCVSGDSVPCRELSAWRAVNNERATVEAPAQLTPVSGHDRKRHLRRAPIGHTLCNGIYAQQLDGSITHVPDLAGGRVCVQVRSASRDATASARSMSRSVSRSW